MQFFEQLIITIIGSALSIGGSLTCTFITLRHYRKKDIVEEKKKINYERPRFAVIKNPFDQKTDNNKFVVKCYDNAEKNGTGPNTFAYTFKNVGEHLITEVYLLVESGVLEFGENYDTGCYTGEAKRNLRIPRTFDRYEIIELELNFFLIEHIIPLLYFYYEDSSGRNWKQKIYIDTRDSSYLSEECSHEEYIKATRS